MRCARRARWPATARTSPARTGTTGQQEDEFLRTEHPQSLADVIVSGADVADWRALLGEARVLG